MNTTTKAAHTAGQCLNQRASDAGWKVAFCPHCNGELPAPEMADFRHDAIIFFKAILPDLEKLATEEARRNTAPTGLPKETARQDRAAWCRAAIDAAEVRNG